MLKLSKLLLDERLPKCQEDRDEGSGEWNFTGNSYLCRIKNGTEDLFPCLDFFCSSPLKDFFFNSHVLICSCSVVIVV